MGYILEVFVVIAVLSVTVPTTTGMRCFSCTHLSVETDDEGFRRGFAGLNLSNPDCGMGVSESKGVKVMDCSSLSLLGRSTSCIKQVGKIEVIYQSKTITMDIAMRSCLPNVGSSSNTCQTQKLTSDILQSFGGLGGSDVQVKSGEGTVCICIGDLCNSQVAVTPETISLLIAIVAAMIFGGD